CRRRRSSSSTASSCGCRSTSPGTASPACTSSTPSCCRCRSPGCDGALSSAALRWVPKAHERSAVRHVHLAADGFDVEFLVHGSTGWAVRVRQAAATVPNLIVPSLLAQDQVHHPAAADVWPWTPAVGEDVGVAAAGVFQGIGEDWQAVECSLI